MLWRDFRFTTFLAVATLVCAVVAGAGIMRYRDARPPDAREVDLARPFSVASQLEIRSAGSFIVDLEFDGKLKARDRLCDAVENPEAGACRIPPRRLDLLWKITDGERVIAEGSVRSHGAVLDYGVFEWISFGSVELPKTDALAVSLWSKPENAWLNAGTPRLRLWRDPGAKGYRQVQGTPATTNTFFGAFFFGFFLLLVFPLELALRKKRMRTAV